MHAFNMYNVCIHVWIYVCIDVCIWVYVHAYIHAYYVYACTYLHVYVHLCATAHQRVSVDSEPNNRHEMGWRCKWPAPASTQQQLRMRYSSFVCIYTYIYIYIFMYMYVLLIKANNKLLFGRCSLLMLYIRQDRSIGGVRWYSVRTQVNSTAGAHCSPPGKRE